jgi:hypothetical protein
VTGVGDWRFMMLVDAGGRHERKPPEAVRHGWARKSLI